MSKSTVRIIAIVLILLLTSAGIVLVASNNKILAYKNRDVEEIKLGNQGFVDSNEYYCLDKGLDYEDGNYVIKDEGMLDDAIVAYAIGYEQHESSEPRKNSL